MDLSKKIKKEAVCTFCSLGCGLKVETLYGSVTGLDYDKDNPINHGSLCPRGNYVVEVLKHPKRLESPRLGKKRVGWQEALNNIALKTKGLKPSQIGAIASATLPCEDLAAAAKLSENFEITWAAPELDDEITLPNLEPESLAGLDTLLVIGDPLTCSPVLSQYINKVKYGNRKNKIIVIDSEETHTAWFATDFIKVAPGGEVALLTDLAGGKSNLLKTLQKSEALGLIVSPGHDAPVILKLAKLAVKQLLGTKGYFATYPIGNALGAKKILNQVKTTGVVQKLLKGELKALFLLGEDLVASYPGEEIRKALLGLSCLVSVDLFKNASGNIAQISLPMSSYLETKSTFVLSGDRIKTLEPVINPRGLSKPVREIVAALGTKVDPSNLEQCLKNKTSKKLSREEIIKLTKVNGKARAEFENFGRGSIVHIGNRSLTGNFAWARVKT